MKALLSGILMVAANAMLAQTPSQPPTLGLNTQQKLDELRRLANQAKESGDLPGETLYLCQAAALDERKFGKKCDRAKGDAAKALAQFDADLEMGRGEVQRKDYAGALRDLGKIKFGPNKAEAQQWMQQARIGLSGGVPVDPASLEAFNAARAAYNRGDFDAVEPQVKRIQAPVIQAAANQLLANISTYMDAMKEADALVHKGDLKGAEAKYQTAATILANGPGHPQDRLREVQAAEARAAASAQLQATASAPIPPTEKITALPSKPKYLTSNRSLTNKARKEGIASDAQDASPPNASGSPDVRQAGSVAGEVLSNDTPKSDGTEDELKEGIADFYGSRFSHADDKIGLYLQRDEKRHAAAAHFYLGASLLTQALLSSPKDQPHADALRQQAHDQFVLAKQMHYRPVEAAVSPKIFEQWTQTGEQ